MADLVKMVDGLPVFNPEARVIAAYNKIIVRARKKTNNSYNGQRDLATKELAYVWLMEDFRSWIRNKYITNVEERDAAARDRLGLNDWKALKDEDILEARRVYAEDHITEEVELLDVAIIATRNMITELKAIAMVADPDTKDVKRSPEALITKADKIGELLIKLKKARRNAETSTSDQKMAKGKVKNIFEDPPNVHSS